jgi:hypothetical protein
MNSTSSEPTSSQEKLASFKRQDSNRTKLNRDELIRLLGFGIEAKEWRFVRQVALTWLAAYPGDLGINLKLAEAWMSDDRPAPARTILERLVSLDPEFLEAWKLLEIIYHPEHGEDWKHTLGFVQVLGGSIAEDEKPPVWAAWLRDAYNRLIDGRLEGAERSLTHMDVEGQALSITTLIRMRLAYARKDWDAVTDLAKKGREQWPDTLGFELVWAEMCLRQGDVQRASAVQSLHRCAAHDSNGQVPRRLWDEKHNFLPLWPEKMEIYFELPLPAVISGRMGLNRLDPGQEVARPEQPKDGLSEGYMDGPLEELLRVSNSGNNPGTELVNGESKQPVLKEVDLVHGQGQREDMRAIEQTFERLARQVKSPQVAREDGRFPVYVVFSCLSGLNHQYGDQTTSIILKEMNDLVTSLKRKQGWDALVFLPDDAEICAKLGMSALIVAQGEDASGADILVDPWKLKLALSDLDAVLVKQGKMIGAVLVVGGPEVVPFHRLPNPADDGDREVLSDNPYGTLDANYFVPEWPVGRIPGEMGSDAGLLMGQLRQMNRQYSRIGKSSRRGFIKRVMDWFSVRVNSLGKKETGAGYSAAVWRQSSKEVYKLIGRDKGLITSPPEVSNTVDTHRLMASQLGYFNLHGLADSGDWYGQRDMIDKASSNEPDYPIALRPADLVKNGRAPKVVFSEACYGAHIIAKRDDQAMSLKFLSLGTAVVVGSTSVSYGSVISPLIGADLLASLFWRYLQQGLTAGQALMQAKIELAQEMNRRQGYLDGEDQKTLISFLLFGDPMTVHNADGIASKRVVRLKQAPQIPMVPDAKQPPQDAGPEMVKAVKQAVERYLPGLDEAEFHVRARPLEAKTTRDTTVIGAKQTIAGGENMVVTISKQVQIAQYTHAQVAHLTLNEKGKMVKLAVSR